jgi:hypothetical protein
MKDAKSRLDAGAETLMGLIKDVEKGAAEACKAGEAEASNQLHIGAGHLRITYGILGGVKLIDGTAATRRKD